ncbi:MAG: hypothetical protein IKQ71_03080 [Lachnospiraceae bacterium]|nr:hypothetical protein [Lachnospiraceae bacterium]
MEIDYKKLQMRGLREVVDYSQKLIPGLCEMIDELRDGRRSDTAEILNLVILGLNWEIEMYNYTEKLINVEKKVIDKKLMTQCVIRLGEVLKSADDDQIADCLEKDFLPFLKTFEKASKETLLRENAS